MQRTVWVGKKMESIFVPYYQINQLCYDNAQLEMCVIDRKTYWVENNSKYENKLSIGNKLVILGLLEASDDRVCLQYDKTFCFS